MIKGVLVKMDFYFSINAPIIQLFGGRRKNIPIEYIYYRSKYNFSIVRVSNGGMCRLIAVFGDYHYFDNYNLPFAIVMSNII